MYEPPAPESAAETPSRARASSAVLPVSLRIVRDAWADRGGTGVRAVRSASRPASGPEGLLAAVRVSLSTRPDPRVADVVPLVAGARIALAVSLEPDDDAMAAAARALGVPCRPLLAAVVDVTLEAEGGERPRVLAGSTGGTIARASFAATLGRDDALAVLTAVHRLKSGLVVRARIGYVAVGRSSSNGSSAMLDVVTPLEQLLDGVDAGELLTLLAPDVVDPSSFVAVPRRVGSSRTRALPLARGEAEPVLVVVRSELARAPSSRALALTPDRANAPTAHALLVSDVLRPAAPHLWLANDVVVEPVDSPLLLPLPIVSDAAAPIWVDRANGGHRFFAPAPTLVRPNAADPAETSAFLFAFEQTGVTAGEDPNPGLHAKVRFTIRVAAGAAVTSALAAAGNPPADAVPLGNLSVTLEVPFREEGTGATKTQSFATTVTLAGDVVTVEVELLDGWVRLLYGSLSYDGFQAQPARLSIAYAFAAYVPLPMLMLQAALTGKISRIPIVKSEADAPKEVDRPTFVTATRTLRLPQGEVRLTTERAIPMAAVAHLAVAPAPVVSHPVAVAPVAHSLPTPLQIPRPPFEDGPILSPIRRARFATRTIVHQESIDVTLLCRDFGNFYLRDGAPIGCQDALRLGAIAYRQYDEIVGLRTPQFQVYRSLQQPGRFLVVPAVYRVGRYAATEPPLRAYRPTLMLYGTGDSPNATRYFVAATLQPDIPYHARRALTVALVAYAPAGTPPQLDFPTDPVVQATASFAWSLPASVSAPDVEQTWNAFQVGVSTDLANGLVLKELIEHSGVRGSVEFSLADGTKLDAQLTIDTLATGPWDTGPLATSRSGGLVTLTNTLAQAVDVGDLLVLRGTTIARIPVGARLATGESRTIDAGGAVDDAWAEATALAAASLEELEVFEEDLTTNIIFVNQVSYANHGLTKLGVALRISGTTHLYASDLVENQTTTMEVTFPLTTYLDPQGIEFQIAKTTSDGAITTTAWIASDLSTQHGVIGVTSQLIL